MVVWGKGTRYFYYRYHLITGFVETGDRFFTESSKNAGITHMPYTLKREIAETSAFKLSKMPKMMIQLKENVAHLLLYYFHPK